jgi:hypothetical protein
METKVHSLSSIQPIYFNYNNIENLKNEYVQFNNGLSLVNYELFKEAEDVVYSNKNLLVLTNKLNLNDVLENTLNETSFLAFGGSFYVKDTLSDVYFSDLNDSVYFFAERKKLLINAVKTESNTFNLYTTEDKRLLQVDENYPYDITLVDQELPTSEKHRQEFYIDFFENKATFKTFTKEGFRFLAKSLDGKLRATGLYLEDTSYNNYYFNLEFLTEPFINKGYDPTIKEVLYSNNYFSSPENLSLNITSSKSADTSFLVSSTFSAPNSSIPLNISCLKNNFTCKGSYNYEQ